MRVKIYDLCKPKGEDSAKFFQVLPTISVVKQFDTWHIYFALFNICLVIHFDNGQ
jgi:hypothetical protein